MRGFRARPTPARPLQCAPAVASTDRAFRALARSEPEVVLALLRLALPDLMREVSVSADGVEDPKLDLPPPLEADMVAHGAPQELLHVEGQGYSEVAFEQRVFHYHLLLVVRHPERRVRTVALWLVRPPPKQRLGRIERDTVTVEVHTVVLAELPASALLAHPETVCFAAGADTEGRADAELCRLVAQALRRQNAGWQRLLLCAAVAAAAGRYDTMMHAMQEADLEPPIIEDLVRYGRERGRREGVEQGVEVGRREGRREGVEAGTREGLLALIAARGLALSPEQRARIEGEHDAERLLGWLRRAAVAASLDDVLED
jgi:predicted transposase YdaD